MEFTAQAILFDIDGTLVDSTPVVERVWRSFAGGRGLDADEILSVCHGRRAEDTVAMFLPEPDRPAAVAELLELELADLDGVVALPATADLLRSLPSGRWAAVTSGARRLMQKRLAAGGLPVPDVLVSAEDVSVGKPDPQGYLLAAERLGYPIEQCLVVEDAPAGLAAGRAAGAHTLAVSTSHDATVLVADAVVADLSSCAFEITPTGIRIVTPSPRQATPSSKRPTP